MANTKLKAAELKAIGWYAKEHNAVPQMSAWPIFEFKPKDGGELIKENINGIYLRYKDAMKEEAKEAARAKRQSQKM